VVDEVMSDHFCYGAKDIASGDRQSFNIQLEDATSVAWLAEMQPESKKSGQQVASLT